jgi:hypothetical protein
MQLDYEDDTASPIQPVHMPTRYGKEEVSLLQDFFILFLYDLHKPISCSWNCLACVSTLDISWMQPEHYCQSIVYYFYSLFILKSVLTYLCTQLFKHSHSFSLKLGYILLIHQMESALGNAL